MTTENAVTDTTTADQTVDVQEQSQQAVNSGDEAASQAQEGTSTEEGTEQHQEPQAKTPEWAQRRFGELTREKHELAREREALAQENARLKQLWDAGQTDGGSTQQPAQRQPVAQGSEDERINARAAQIVSEQQFQVKAKSAGDKGKEEFPDFEQAVVNLNMLGVPDELVRAVVEMEDAHRVFYALGTDPDETARILALPPIQQGRALEKLAAKPKAPGKKPPVSNAPPPIGSPVTNGKGSKETDLASADINEFMARRNSESKRR